MPGKDKTTEQTPTFAERVQDYIQNRLPYAGHKEERCFQIAVCNHLITYDKSFTNVQKKAVLKALKESITERAGRGKKHLKRILEDEIKSLSEVIKKDPPSAPPIEHAKLFATDRKSIIYNLSNPNFNKKGTETTATISRFMRQLIKQNETDLFLINLMTWSLFNNKYYQEDREVEASHHHKPYTHLLSALGSIIDSITPILNAIAKHNEEEETQSFEETKGEENQEGAAPEPTPSTVAHLVGSQGSEEPEVIPKPSENEAGNASPKGNEAEAKAEPVKPDDIPPRADQSGQSAPTEEEKPEGKTSAEPTEKSTEDKEDSSPEKDEEKSQASPHAPQGGTEAKREETPPSSAEKQPVAEEQSPSQEAMEPPEETPPSTQPSAESARPSVQRKLFADSAEASDTEEEEEEHTSTGTDEKKDEPTEMAAGAGAKEPHKNSPRALKPNRQGYNTSLSAIYIKALETSRKIHARKSQSSQSSEASAEGKGTTQQDSAVAP